LLGVSTLVDADERFSPRTFALKIERQPLTGALQQVARQANLQVIFFSRVTEGLAAPAIEGDYTLVDAMQRLLDGSQLTFRVINERTVEVRPSRSKAPDYSRVQLGATANPAPVGVGAPEENGATIPIEEVLVVGLAEQLVATRVAMPLREIPQTLSIVTREQIRLQNSTELADVLNRAPGISMSRNDSLVTEFHSRGYLVDSLHVDGGAGLSTRLNSTVLFMATPDLSEFDHVEILRGADALFSGNSNPGGTVSLVRKRPQANFAIEFNTSADAHDGRRAEIDVTGPLSDDGTLRGRADVVYDREGYFYDVASRERTKIFGALESDLSANSVLTAGASYQWEDATPVIGGLPLYDDGTDSRLPRDFALGFDWSWYQTRVGEAYLQYRHEWSPEWALKLNAAGWRTEVQYEYGYVEGTLSRATNRFDRAPRAVTSEPLNIHEQFTFDATLMGTLDWFGWREELAIGIDWTSLEARAGLDQHTVSHPPVGDVRTFDPADYPFNADPVFGVAATMFEKQYGMFASLRVYFDEKWSVVAGARIRDERGSARGSIRTELASSTVSSRAESDFAVLPYAAIMYSIGDHYSLYASHADVFAYQDNVRLLSGRRIRPVTGANTEVGIKGEWRGGALNGSAVVYRIEQENLSNRVTWPVDGTGDCCYSEASSRSRGVDIEFSGELSPGWRVGAGYTYNTNEAPGGVVLSAVTPKHLLKAWTNLRLPGEYRRWEIGGSLHAQSATKSRGGGCLPACPVIDFVHEPYAVLDLRAAFNIDSNWSASLSVDNVFDRIYYESIDTPLLRGWYGPPRTAILRIDGRF
jgi:outer membrane receptor for ferric coprogen and ferric-rhodotorulic acid